jgi:phosphoadenosine phosphosulfate reductase
MAESQLLEQTTSTGAANGPAARLAASFGGLGLPARLAATRREISGRLVFTTSFGLEDQAIAHAILSQNLAIDLVTLDTGRLFPETYDVWAATEKKFSCRIRALSPEQRALEGLISRQGINGFRNSVAARQACCAVRKVEPLGRALAGAAGWITGLRAEQSQARAGTDAVLFDTGYNVVKINPLFDWRRSDVADFVRAHDVPHNTLHDRGFLSIGCAPCTRAVKPGEPERAGRWWWEQEEKKECGLHGRSLASVVRADRQTTGIPAND